MNDNMIVGVDTHLPLIKNCVVPIKKHLPLSIVLNSLYLLNDVCTVLLRKFLAVITIARIDIVVVPLP